MNKIDLWHLCDELSVPEASLLILGLDPADMKNDPERLAKPRGCCERIICSCKACSDRFRNCSSR